MPPDRCNDGVLGASQLLLPLSCVWFSGVHEAFDDKLFRAYGYCCPVQYSTGVRSVFAPLIHVQICALELCSRRQTRT